MKNRPLIVVLLIVLAAISMATAVYAKSAACDRVQCRVEEYEYLTHSCSKGSALALIE